MVEEKIFNRKERREREREVGRMGERVDYGDLLVMADRVQELRKSSLPVGLSVMTGEVRVAFLEHFDLSPGVRLGSLRRWCLCGRLVDYPEHDALFLSVEPWPGERRISERSFYRPGGKWPGERRISERSFYRPGGK